MTASKDERTAAQDFALRYARRSSDATRELERAVIGGDFGANGYTTMDQADLLGQRLELGPGSRLLDIGAGQGWPGLYLAKTTGCAAVLTDLPHEAMRTARERASGEGVASRCRPLVASARRLPFREASFDAIVHTDVLC